MKETSLVPTKKGFFKVKHNDYNTKILLVRERIGLPKFKENNEYSNLKCYNLSFYPYIMQLLTIVSLCIQL